MLPPRIAALKKQLAAANLALSNINAFTLFANGDTYHPTWIEDDLRLVARRIEHTKNTIRMAAALGAPTISLQPGGPLFPDTPSRREQALRRFQAGLEEVLPLADQHAVTLLVEPEPGLLIQHADDCVRFLQRLRHPRLKMNADLGHFFCVGDDPAAVLRTHAPWIGHVHLEDIGANHVHQHLVPGEGAMDWPGIFTALRAIHYTGWLTVELYPFVSTAEDVARQAFTFLQQFIA
jgi:sugar phosphate isomerase/epimerase